MLKHNILKTERCPDVLGELDIIEFSKDFFKYSIELMDKIENLDQFLSFNNSLKKYLSFKGNKNGNVMPRQTFMDLLIDNDSIINNGDTVYYVNIGIKKTHSDSSRDSKTGKLFVELIDQSQLHYSCEYNIEKYINDLNTKINGLLVCFKQHVKETLLINNPNDIKFYTDEDLELISWGHEEYPYNKKDLDDLYADGKNLALFKMEDREVRFWNKIGIDPNIIFDKFTTNKELIVKTPYYEKYKEYRDKLKAKNIDLKHIKGRYENGDIVLIEENNKFYLAIFENNKFIKEKELK